jgi:hypothetical protein
MRMMKHITTLIYNVSEGTFKYCIELLGGLGELLVGRSRDRSPVVSLGIFSEASDKPMCPGSTQPLKMSTRIFLGVNAAGT